MYKNPSLSQCVLSMLVLCVVMFMANIGLEEDITLFVKMLCFLCAAGLQIAIYCYNGQKIITQVYWKWGFSSWPLVTFFHFRAKNLQTLGITVAGTMNRNSLNILLTWWLWELIGHYTYKYLDLQQCRIWHFYRWVFRIFYLLVFQFLCTFLFSDRAN